MMAFILLSNFGFEPKIYRVIFKTASVERPLTNLKCFGTFYTKKQIINNI